MSRDVLGTAAGHPRTLPETGSSNSRLVQARPMSRSTSDPDHSDTPAGTPPTAGPGDGVGSVSQTPTEDLSGSFADAHDDFDLKPRARTRRVDPLLGADLGGITIVRLVGEGGMGRVYEAHQKNPSRTVAVKVMRQGLAGGKSARRFEREAEFLGRLQHPGIAQIYVVGSYSSDDGEVPFFVMEFIADAKSITTFAAEGGLSVPDRLRLFASVCEAVSHGHARGIIHRDLKPSNILIDGSGVPRVIDFGVARNTDSALTLTSMHTQAGNLIGTTQYMSPEQFGARPDELDPRADVYSLGVVLYELLSGDLPHELRDKGIHEIARLICEQPPVPLKSRGKGVPRPVAAIVEKCLEKNRDHRYQSAGELADDIRRYVSRQPVRALKGSFFRPRWVRRLVPASRVGQALLLLVTGGLFTSLATVAAWRLVDPSSLEGFLLTLAGSSSGQKAARRPAGPVTKEVFLTSVWQNTGLTVEKDLCYRLTVTGALRDNTGAEFGPEGTCPVMLRTVLGPPAGLPPATRSQGYVGQHPIRAVIARIGNKSWSINVGPGLTFIAPDSGQLSLRINEPARSSLAPEGTLTCTLEYVPQPRFIDDSGRTTIWASIDHADTLLISTRGLQWAYGGQWARVGLHEGVFPTLVNGIAWWPTWPDPVTSSVLETADFAGVAKAIASGGQAVQVLDVTARHGRAGVVPPQGDVARVMFMDLALGSGDIGCTFNIVSVGGTHAPGSTPKTPGD
jgi:hypothetical protein